MYNACEWGNYCRADATGVGSRQVGRRATSSYGQATLSAALYFSPGAALSSRATSSSRRTCLASPIVGLFHGTFQPHLDQMQHSMVGYAAISPYRTGRGAFEETCEISCYLSGAYRGRGFGKELVKHAIEYARRAGFRLVIAAVLGCNQRSIGPLSRLGFSIFGKLPNAAKINSAHFDHIYLFHSLL